MSQNSTLPLPRSQNGREGTRCPFDVNRLHIINQRVFASCRFAKGHAKENQGVENFEGNKKCSGRCSANAHEKQKIKVSQEVE